MLRADYPTVSSHVETWRLAWLVSIRNTQSPGKPFFFLEMSDMGRNYLSILAAPHFRNDKLPASTIWVSSRPYHGNLQPRPLDDPISWQGSGRGLLACRARHSMAEYRKSPRLSSKGKENLKRKEKAQGNCSMEKRGFHGIITVLDGVLYDFRLPH